ncbi:MAG TPA: hypothetical protein VH593_28905, partial [Ktedonobacteraceae bacterium]
MPTLEERVAALERAHAVMRSEQIDTGQIEEQMSALQQQVAEQQRRLAVQDEKLSQILERL